MTMTPADGPPLELWGGIECTVNRVGAQYFDQLERNGHARRPHDLDLIAGLGIRVLRYPVLWERTAPHEGAEPDWAWTDDRLGNLQALGIRPIVGLVHHGSGPRHTSLLDPDFPAKLAAYADRVARRYPWVRDYTPVNEPLTTARFSALYGHWYPHHRDNRSFVRALLNQCRGVAEAMRAIREVRPDARLVQTDDLGKVHAPETLGYQADFENERRWATFDLLAGRVDRGHPLWTYFGVSGATEAELHWFRDHPCAPDLLGFNYYLTSERFLDDRLDRYSAALHGGNGGHVYADVEAVRGCPDCVVGLEGLLREAWDRYRLPMAVTEAHLGCTREDQLRWLADIWAGARAARSAGVDVRAVTAWSLLGAYDWDSLVTRPQGNYESGAFDVRSGEPRLTALGRLVRTLATGREPDHPLLAIPGWWHPGRVADAAAAATGDPAPAWDPGGRPLLIAGGGGTLAQSFARVCRQRGVPYRLLTRLDMDIADADSATAALARYEPWAIVNTAGFVGVDEAERRPEACFRENLAGPTVLAALCASRGIRLLTFSSDLVFDGYRMTPYREGDHPCPRNVYGRSKAIAERDVLELHPAALVVRTGAFFGPWDGANFVTQALTALGDGRPFEAADDWVVSPTYMPDLAHASLDLLIDEERGVWHLANAGAVTWADLARLAADRAGLDEKAVVGRPVSDFGFAAERPSYSVLGSDRGVLLPSLDDALGRYLQESGRHAPAAA